MAKSTAAGPLVWIYERRIGVATNTNEVLGYWAFLAGVLLGLLGVVVYSMTAAATTGRGVGYALAALAPALFMAGAVLRFPLRRAATALVGVGLALTVAAIAWILLVFPGGWSLTTGNSTVILAYVAGLAVIGVADSIVPLATDARDAATSPAGQRAEPADAAGADTADLSPSSGRTGTGSEEPLAAGNVGLEGDDADLGSSKAAFELYAGSDDQWRWRLVHDNDNIIADSGEGYSSKSMAKQGLGSVKLNALGAAIVER